MTIDRKRFEQILMELIDENPIACQGVLAILKVVYTEDVPTLAVSLSDPPTLFVNIDFVAREASAEIHVKTLLLHEFLHVLLNHTENFETMDAFANIALDAVINHLIHRVMGEDYTDFIRRYYRWATGISRLLRPDPGTRYAGDTISRMGGGLLDGSIVADDILSLADELKRSGAAVTGLPEETVLLGHHATDSGDISERGLGALRETLKSYDGHGMFRSPKAHGFGADPYPERWSAADEDLAGWRASTYRLLRSLCLPDPKSRVTEEVASVIHMPVLNASDRRAFLRALWNPVILDVAWPVHRRKPGGSTVVYLDVSGSMNSEMQQIVALLWRLSHCIRMPFWAFSDEVAPAQIREGVLETETSGGTSMNSVLKHFTESGARKAVVITDGYIEQCDPALTARITQGSLHALVSRDGSPAVLEGAGIPYHQLAPCPRSSCPNSADLRPSFDTPNAA